MWFALLVVQALFDTYSVPSESSKPTLLVGDYVIAMRVNPDVLQRGDTLAFVHPVNGQTYIKRLIGLPGDRVQMRGGVVWLNGTPLPQTPNGTFEEILAPQGAFGSIPRCANAPVGAGGVCIRDRLTETLPEGRSHDVLNTDDGGFADNTDVFTVPGGMLFFLGDNRDNSLDSRFAQQAGGLGFVPVENVVGRARVVAFSSAGASLADVSSWRPGRYWTAIE